MKYDELMSKLFGFSVPTYYNWKKENRPIINFINSFSNVQIEEFLESGTFLFNPRTLLFQYEKIIMGFVNVILIGKKDFEMSSFGDEDEEIDKYLDVLIYSINNSECFSPSYTTKDIINNMQRYYDDYKKLYNVNSFDLASYTDLIDELAIQNIDFSDLIVNNFKSLIFYSAKFNIMNFNIVLKFYLRYLYFKDIDKERKISLIYEQTKAIYKNEKTGKIYNENLISPYEKSDNYSLIFNYDLFKSLIV